MAALDAITCALAGPAGLDEVFRQLEVLEPFFTDNGVPSVMAGKLVLALEELLTNTATHGAAQSGAAPRLWVEAVITDGAVHVEIADDGVAFDPTAHPEPDVMAEADDRAVGGLGVHLVRSFMDEFSYERRDGRNIVRLTMHLSAP